MLQIIKKAFTLIELLVVIAIIGILSGMIVVSMSGVTTKANLAKAQIFSNSLKNALMGDTIGEWRLDEGSTQSTIDSWRSINNGTLGSTTGIDDYDPTWTTTDCVYGNCLDFDGSNDYVQMIGSDDANNILAITGAITISGWAKFNLTGIGYNIVSRGPSTSNNGNYGYAITRGTNNKIFFSTSSTSLTDGFYSLGTITDTNWHFIVGTWDGTTNTDTKKIYIDGKLDNKRTSTISAMGTPTLIFKIGNTSNNFYPMDGLIDEVRIYNVAAPISQIREEYYAGLNNLLINGNISKEEYTSKINNISYEQTSNH